MSALRKQQLLEDTLAVTAATTQTITAVPTHLGNPGWSDFLAMALVAFFMILVFWILLRLSKKWTQTMVARIKEAESRRRSNRDTFRVENGYSWDCCIVFKVRKTGDPLTPKQNDNSIKKIVGKLNRAGLETRLFYSIQHDEVYCKIRAPLTRLMIEADRIDYKLLLDPNAIEAIMTAGRPGKWNPVRIPAVTPQTSMNPYEFIYSGYRYDETTQSTREDLINVYKRRSNNTYFRGIDRLKLISGIIRERENEGGCMLEMRGLELDGCILGFMCLHDNVELRTLEAKWLVFMQMPWKQEIDMAKDYFGEKVGLYFLWLGHYTTWLFPAAIIGIFAWIDIAANGNDPNAPTIPYYSAFMALWATCFLESWKRKEAWYGMRWGSTGFEQEELARPQFLGEKIPSAITGEGELYFSKSEYSRRLCVSASVISMLVVVVLGVVVSLFALRFALNHSDVTINGAPAGSIISSIAQAIIIGILNYLYSFVADALNKHENHRTDTEYEDNLIAKVFIFQFVNSYAALFYVAFVRPFISDIDPCLDDNCMKELQTTLGTIFITRLVTGIVLSTSLPVIFQTLRERENFAGIDDERLQDVSEIERSFMKEPYDVFLGTFADYSDMAIQFGFTTMFISAFPLAAAMSLINNYIMLRVGGWKLCQIHRRPEPRTAEDIGTWQSILEIIAFSAVIVNAGLVAFTGKITDHYKSTDRVWIFIGIVGSLMIAKSALAFFVPDVPLECEIQLARQNFIESKIIYDTPDDGDAWSLDKAGRVEGTFAIKVIDDDAL